MADPALSSFLILKCVTPITSHPAWYRRNKHSTPPVPVDASLDAPHGRDVGGSPFRPANDVQLRRRNKALNVEHFAGSGTWHVPKRHSDSVYSGAPKRHIDGEISELFRGDGMLRRSLPPPMKIWDWMIRRRRRLLSAHQWRVRRVWWA
jgi:hypothetical protein